MNNEYYYIGLAGAALGAAAAGSIMTGASYMQVLTTFNGALGTTAGYWAGDLVGNSMSKPEVGTSKAVAAGGEMYPIIGSILMPAAVHGGLDGVIVGMAVGAYVGQQVLRQVVVSMSEKK